MVIRYKDVPTNIVKASSLSQQNKDQHDSIKCVGGKIMTIQFRKMTITLELLELWTPNKRHLVPYGQTNHMILNLNS